ncbi:MAG: M64 family metallo-endopeptidase [Myxococcales bacterium]|nr:M64 family metallo-endopeptidase [Myxococcales bacterium]
MDTAGAGADDAPPDTQLPPTEYPGPPERDPLDCGPDGWAVEDHGPPDNRVNYLILADGYDATTIHTTLETHIQNMLDVRFNHEKGEPYGRYRKFVNICVAKVVSQTDGIGNGPTAFDGGNGGDRLARVNQGKVTDYINANIPPSFEIDWNAVVLNQDRWENTGSILMLWSGAGRDAPGAALHEGGHGFHQLADEYCGSGTGTRCGPEMCGGSGTEHAEVNTTGDCSGTGGKWDLWLGSTQKGLKVPDMGATGLQSTFAGSRYVDSGQYRPSGNSMMNSLFGDDVNTSYNSVSREQMIFSIWRAVEPIDSTEPEAGAVSGPSRLIVHVIDPEVIHVDWSVDGEVVAENGGPVFDIASAGLEPGTYTIAARAYDNADEDLVRNRSSQCPSSVTGRYCHGTGWSRSEQTVSWTATVE